MKDRVLTQAQAASGARIDEEYEAERQDKRDEGFLLHFSKTEAELIRLEQQALALRKALGDG